MQNTFSDEVKTEVIKAQNGYCAIDGCLNKIHSIHHILPKTKVNLRKYPLLINSVINAKGLCQYHHENYTLFSYLKISHKTAEMYEKYLQKLVDTNKNKV